MDNDLKQDIRIWETLTDPQVEQQRFDRLQFGSNLPRKFIRTGLNFTSCGRFYSSTRINSPMYHWGFRVDGIFLGCVNDVNLEKVKV